MFFMLFIIGAGSYSVDRRWIGDEATRSSLNWDQGGLLVRLSVAFPLLVGGAFHGEASIQTFGMPSWMLLLIAIPLILNVGARWAGVATVLVIAWFIASSFDASRSLIANMNAAKREYAFLAASVVLGFCGGGRLFSIRSGREGLKRLLRPGRTVGNSGAIGAKA
jgi:uncharacterized membrane protein YphA (DoxX/SURF4 family)